MNDQPINRRRLLINAGRLAVLAGLACGGAALLRRAVRSQTAQIDPQKCKFCGGCSRLCVRQTSAVKAVNDFEPCGYCVYCYGYYPDDPHKNPNARICPTGALKRRKVSQFEYEYTIDESVCIGCGKCVKRCWEHGNKSLKLMVRGQYCLECNRCRIVAKCPHGAIHSRTGEA